MTLRAMGGLNGLLPQPTDMLVAFLLDPSKMPFLKYTQMIEAPEITFMYAVLDSDESVRLVDLNEFAWAYDDYRPTGKGFTVRAEWISSTVQRWDFPYTLGEATIRVWQKNGINARSVFDEIRATHASLHRASRVVATLRDASWPTFNTATLNTLLGTVGSGFDKSSGDQYDPATGIENPHFQVIKRAFNIIKQRIHLATNGAVDRNSLIAVVPPVVARAMSESGEIFEALKQSRFSKELIDLPQESEDWNLLPRYAGFRIVVEDTPRVFINQKASGVVADVTVPAEKDYILADDTVYFLSRPGGLKGEAGHRSYSTVQCWHFGGPGRVEAFSEKKHELVEGHNVMEDRVLTPALVSGFKLTDVLTV